MRSYKTLKTKVKSKIHKTIARKRTKLQWLISLALIVWLGVVCSVVLMALGLVRHQSYARVTTVKLTNTDASIATDDSALRKYIVKHGPEAAIQVIKTTPVDCHQRAHKVGRMTFQLRNNDAFKVMDSNCQSGYIHGMIEAFFDKNGTDNLQQHLALICKGVTNEFIAHQCYHGVGHGLMAFTDYDIPATLKDCDLLPTHQQSCYSGAFMENVVGAIASDQAKSHPTAMHFSNYLSNDPLYPCNAVEEKYANACYFYQSSRMLQIFGPDFGKIAAGCSSIPNANYQASCFGSMGRDVSNTYGDDYAAISTACSEPAIVSAANRLFCIDGAAQDRFWDVSEQKQAVSFCAALEEVDYKSHCYATIVGRARYLMKDIAGFCSALEPAYAKSCSHG